MAVQGTDHACGVASLQSVMAYYGESIREEVLGNYTFVSIPEFLDRWHDIDTDGVTKIRNFGICVTKDKPVYAPYKIERME